MLFSERMRRFLERTRTADDLATLETARRNNVMLRGLTEFIFEWTPKVEQLHFTQHFTHIYSLFCMVLCQRNTTLHILQSWEILYITFNVNHQNQMYTQDRLHLFTKQIQN